MTRDRGDCPHLQNAAPYALGAIEDDRAYAAHLAECDACAAEVAELSGAMQKLPQTPPDVKAPQDLIDRVMSTVREEAALLNAAGAGADEAAPRKRGVFSRLAQELDQHRLAASGAGAALLACIAIFAVVTTGGPAPTKVTPGEVAAQLRGGGANAKLVESGGAAHLEVAGMPAPGAGRIYEVWIQHQDGSISPTKSLFDVTGGGDGSVHVTDSLEGVSAVLVTSEPAGGSATPTRKPVVTVKIPS